MRSQSCLAAILSLLLAACGGGGGGGGATQTGSNPVTPHAPAAPSNLVATQGGTPDEVLLSWTRTTDPSDGYWLEAKVGDTPYQVLNSEPIPATVFSVLLTFSSSAPDAITYTFRLRASYKTAMSSYSNEAPYFRNPMAPSQVVATYDMNANRVNLSWTRNTTGSDGLLIERAECTQYGIITGAWVSLPITDPLASTYVDQTFPRDRYYVYQVINLKGSQAGQPSLLSSPVFAGYMPIPWISATFDGMANCIRVSWWVGSLSQATGILLERSDYNSSGALLGNWTPLPIPSGLPTFDTDSSIAENAQYAYRATNLYGTNLSIPSQVIGPVSVPLFSPSNLQVVATSGGLQLNWQNRSLVANQVVIRRSPTMALTNDVALLTPTATGYLDPVSSLGYYSYTVVAKSGSEESPSNAVVAATLNRPDSLLLSSAPLGLPTASIAALRPSGTWAFAVLQPLGILSNNDPWPANAPVDSGETALPVIQVDGQGWPHAIYATRPASSSSASTVVHLWFDGVHWQSESLTTAIVPSSYPRPSLSYRLDSSGQPQVLVDHVTTQYPSGGSTASLSYFHKANGVWVEEPLDGLTPLLNITGTFHISLDAADTPHLLIGNGSSLIDYARTGPGQWSSTTLPVGSEQIYAGADDFVDSLWIDQNHGLVFYESDVPGGTGLNVLQIKDGVWLSPQILDTRPLQHFSNGYDIRCALSPDHSRAVVLYSTSVGLKTYHQLPDGWHATLAAPPGVAWMATGFDGNQKLHILTSTYQGFVEIHE
jgi:hypothetical protein